MASVLCVQWTQKYRQIQISTFSDKLQTNRDTGTLNTLPVQSL